MYKKVMLFYPPGEMYQRGEDRSQGNISSSAATVMRAPNDMGYVGAILKKRKFKVTFRDYQTEKLSLNEFYNDYKKQNPDIVIFSTTNSTIKSDLMITKQLKKINNSALIVIKGAIFFNPEKNC